MLAGLIGRLAAAACLVARGARGAQCGDCWCVPDNATGACPEWRPANYSAAFARAALEVLNAKCGVAGT